MKLAALALVLGSGMAHAGCGAAEAPCTLPQGSYHLVMPQGGTGPVPAVVFLHGHGADGAAMMRISGMRDAILARGYALIAPDGRDRDGSNGGSWSFHPDRPARRDEVAFLRAVMDDAAARNGLDRNRMVLAGFSIGGSMTAYAACAAPELAAAYAPVGGNFWRPHPATCTAPVRLLHTHGWADRTVPLEGRYFGNAPVAPGQVAQGDVFAAMEIWRTTNGCTLMRPDAFEVTESFWRRRWDACAPASALELALFPGAHSIPKAWAPMMLDWFEATVPYSAAIP